MAIDRRPDLYREPFSYLNPTLVGGLLAVSEHPENWWMYPTWRVWVSGSCLSVKWQWESDFGAMYQQKLSF